MAITRFIACCRCDRILGPVPRGAKVDADGNLEDAEPILSIVEYDGDNEDADSDPIDRADLYHLCPPCKPQVAALIAKIKRAGRPTRAPRGQGQARRGNGLASAPVRRRAARRAAADGPDADATA